MPTSKLPPRLSERSKVAKADTLTRIAWAESLIDKQYRLFVWNDSKIQVLAAVNGLLFAAVGVIFKNGPTSWYSAIPLILSVVCLLLSLWTCLTALRHFPHSGRSQEKRDAPNLRSIKGMLNYGSWTDYAQEFTTASPKEFLNHTLRQVWGMAINNDNCHRRMRFGVLLTFCGVALIIVGLALDMVQLSPIGNPYTLGPTQHLQGNTSDSANAVHSPEITNQRNGSKIGVGAPLPTKARALNGKKY